MAAKINKANPDVVTNATLNTFLGLANLEQQIAYLFALAIAAQNAFNANATTPVSRFAANPSFSARTVTYQSQLALTDGALAGKLSDSVQSAGIQVSKLQKQVSDNITDSVLNELLALDSLEKQITWLVVRLSVAENTYNSANPTSTFNRVTVSPNYDSNLVQISVTLGLLADAILTPAHEAVVAYL